VQLLILRVALHIITCIFVVPPSSYLDGKSFIYDVFLLALQPQFGPWPTSMKLSVSLRYPRS
jgi:hypothetical protein